MASCPSQPNLSSEPPPSATLRVSAVQPTTAAPWLRHQHLRGVLYPAFSRILPPWPQKAQGPAASVFAPRACLKMSTRVDLNFPPSSSNIFVVDSLSIVDSLGSTVTARVLKFSAASWNSLTRVVCAWVPRRCSCRRSPSARALSGVSKGFGPAASGTQAGLQIYVGSRALPPLLFHDFAPRRAANRQSFESTGTAAICRRCGPQISAPPYLERAAHSAPRRPSVIHQPSNPAAPPALQGFCPAASSAALGLDRYAHGYPLSLPAIMPPVPILRNSSAHQSRRVGDRLKILPRGERHRSGTLPPRSSPVNVCRSVCAANSRKRPERCPARPDLAL
uniref:Uncharacterized protein n=1 Tax=Mycena chlorophos TaxID=658473 RepID=A0ABQ0LFM0_MYCCL|nr:predicted protein [Mycena chlorophos]